MKVAQRGIHQEDELRHEHLNLLQAQTATFELSMRRVFKAKTAL